MNQVDILIGQVPEIEKQLHYVFEDKNRLVLAFVHRSFYNEHRDQVEQHNERLEFLGDSVLGILIADYLYRELPLEAEGRLSLLRSNIVEASSCVHLLQMLDISRFLLLGRGEKMNDGKGRETILADLFEAILGAIYLDGGFEAARAFFFHHFTDRLQIHLNQPTRNWKAELQDFSQKKHQKPPTYKVLKEEGPDHSKVFHVAAHTDSEAVGFGAGSTKKEAEQAAAEDALRRLGVITDE